MNIDKIRKDIESVIHTKKMAAIGTMMTDQENGYEHASSQSHQIVQEIQAAIHDEERLDSLSNATDATSERERQALQAKYAQGKPFQVPKD